MERKTAAVIFGGQSSEHEVSCMSAANVIDRINKEKYDLLLIGITLDGHWIKTESVEEIRSGEWRNGKVSAAILPDATKKCAILMDGDKVTEVKLDLVFPVLHGLHGEDGTIQGLLELAKIPYVGCGVLASAVGMDKLYTKIIVNNLGIRQADYEPVMSEQLADMDAVTARIEAHFAYPVFIKPSNAGSSKGVSKAENREELEAGLKEAAKHDRKILVEETIIGREIECAVFGGGKEEVAASGVGEILAAADFYDFDSSCPIDLKEYDELSVEDIKQPAIDANLLSRAGSCPICSAPNSVVLCGNCKQLHCAPTSGEVTCPWCGTTGTLQSVNSLSLNRSRG